jgi:Ca2+-binding RTX toxin-like protein
VAAYSGDNFGVNANDANSFSNGDHYTAVSGTDTSIHQVQGSSYADLIYAGSDSLVYYNTYGGNDVLYASTGGVSYLGYDQNDSLYGGSGNDNYYFSRGNDVADGSTGFDILRTNSFYNGDYNVVTYLDATADTNNNGVADYIDRGVTSLVSGGVTYMGFEYGWGNATSANTAYGSTLVKNFDNIVGNTVNDYLVGNANVNEINARGGFNTIYGLGGNDIITAIEGTNTIDGGNGTDTVNFQYANSGAAGSIGGYGTNNNYGVQVFLADGAFTGASDKNLAWGTGHTSDQSRTGTTGAYLYSQITNVENINGSDYADVLYGNSSANTIYGNNGDDIIAGNGGADSLYGGAGNDTFRVTASDLANVVLFDGSTGTDTIVASGWSFASDSIANAKYSAIETIDVRNSAAGGTYGLSANDIRYLADNGNSSAVTLKLDSGDTFTVAGGSFETHSTVGADTTYHYYSDAGHGTQIALLTVHYGA